jgi:hypothetical protein
MYPVLLTYQPLLMVHVLFVLGSKVILEVLNNTRYRFDIFLLELSSSISPRQAQRRGHYVSDLSPVEANTPHILFMPFKDA